MNTVYHVTSIFQPTTEASAEQFEARITILGARLERFIRCRLWHLCACPDDMDDAIQGALIRLWRAYNDHPDLMDEDDHQWLRIGVRAAQNTLRQMSKLRGIKKANGIQRLEFTTSSLEHDGDDRDGLETAEVRHFRSSNRTRRPESEQVDRWIDAERLMADAVGLLTTRQRQALRLLIPLVMEGYAINEAARKAGLGVDRAKHTWDAFQHTCETVSGQVRDTMRGKGARASAEELAEIRALAAQGLSCAVIAQRLGRSKAFVLEHFERATGYRRGANNQRNPISPQRVAQMRQLQAQGLSMSAIARQVGCSAGSVCTWLNR